jgi:hypothetical protein
MIDFDAIFLPVLPVPYLTMYKQPGRTQAGIRDDICVGFLCGMGEKIRRYRSLLGKLMRCRSLMSGCFPLRMLF